jgi:hypothetical protein
VTWQRIDLADARYAVTAEPPRYSGLIYAQKRHLISGPPESVKTLFAWAILRDAMRDGAKVAAADFEMGPEATRLLLVELGFTLEEIAAVHYFEPEIEPEPADIDYLVHAGVDIMLLDALAGAYDASGLDDNKRKDVEIWQKLWTRPLYRAGIASIATDHVVKNVEARGNFSIGSERKAGTIDVHLGLEVVKPLGRGGNGLFKAHIKKDRPAYLRAGGTREIEIHSHPETHAITWTIAETGTASSSEWQPTILMERVSEFLATQDEPVTRNTVERAVRGNSAKYLRQAIDELVSSGYVEQTEGPRNAKLVRSVKPYTTASDCVPTASDALGATDDTTASTASPAYRRDAVADAVEANDRDEDDRVAWYEQLAATALADEAEFA